MTEITEAEVGAVYETLIFLFDEGTSREERMAAIRAALTAVAQVRKLSVDEKLRKIAMDAIDPEIRATYGLPS